MNDASQAARDGLRLLSLQFQVLDEGPDRPVVRILVDGADPFAAVAPGWRGFDPAQVLGSRSVLLPRDPWRRTALYRCSCGTAGCGVIAPLIVRSPDGRRVSWTDFRDYVGVFDGPVEASADRYDGRPWALPDLHFDREQYVAEVRRAAADTSWESPRRRTARLLHERLEPLALTLPPDLVLGRTAPVWDGNGIGVVFQGLVCGRRSEKALRLTSTSDDPEAAAQDMVEQLLSTAPEDWTVAFGLRPS